MMDFTGNMESNGAILGQLLPSFSMLAAYPFAGGLMAYGANGPAQWKEGVVYVDRVLTSARCRPTGHQPTKFGLVINLKTAKALGIAVPASLNRSC
jgi:putative tryptophan/tyrosine transport system substrate-binding protein